MIVRAHPHHQAGAAMSCRVDFADRRGMMMPTELATPSGGNANPIAIGFFCARRQGTTTPKNRFMVGVVSGTSNGRACPEQVRAPRPPLISGCSQLAIYQEGRHVL